jgi:hypothetical protein
MRMSVRKDDPGYDPNAVLFIPYLDGVKLDNCFTADEEEGKAYCFSLDKEGNQFIDKETNEIAEEILHGNIYFVDVSTEADAKRMLWILNGNGYFMEERTLCGHAPCDEEEQNEARREIDLAMRENE